MTALLYIIAVHDNKDYKRLVRYVSWDNYRFAGYYLSAPRASKLNMLHKITTATAIAYPVWC